MLAIGVASLILCGLTSVRATAGDVRPLQERGTRVLAKGSDASMTFRQLIDRIAQSDVIAYVDLAPYEEPGLEGALEFVATVGGARYVRVWLQPRRTDDELIVTLGHELQHVVEVADAPQVVSQDSLAVFCAHTGKSDKPGHFETRAAQLAAKRIRTEMSGPRELLAPTATATPTATPAGTLIGSGAPGRIDQPAASPGGAPADRPPQTGRLGSGPRTTSLLGIAPLMNVSIQRREVMFC